MTFTGFTQKDFEVFHVDGLDARMQAIRERIQPKFQMLAQELLSDITLLAGNDMYVHVAKHARRTINPPKDTWMSFCHNKRGYKQHPHFQIGLFDDRVFLWLAFIYEAPNKHDIAERLLKRKKLLQQIPKDYYLSVDHMKKEAATIASLSTKGVITAVERFRDVKQAELLIGRVIMMDDPLLADGAGFTQLARDTFTQLIPLYETAMGR